MNTEITTQEQRMGILTVLEQAVLKGVKELERTPIERKYLTYLDGINKIGMLSSWHSKSKLFVTIDSRSETYSHILFLAKKSLVELKDDKFQMNCSELIRAFMNLSNSLRGKKFLGRREEGELIIKVEKENIVEISQEKEGKEIREGITGNKLIKIISEREKLDLIEL